MSEDLGNSNGKNLKEQRGVYVNQHSKFTDSLNNNLWLPLYQSLSVKKQKFSKTTQGGDLQREGRFVLVAMTNILVLDYIILSDMCIHRDYK